jgi:hypothetical protein
MAEVRTRADQAQHAIPATVSIDTPEDALFLPEALAHPSLPSEALTCALTRARGVADVLWFKLNERKLNSEAATAWALMGLIDQIDRLVSFSADVEFGAIRPVNSASMEGQHHA